MFDRESREAGFVPFMISSGSFVHRLELFRELMLLRSNLIFDSFDVGFTSLSGESEREREIKRIRRA